MSKPFKSLDADVKKLATDLAFFMQETVVRSASKAGKNVANDNPILTGLSSGNWQAGVGAPKLEELERFYPTESNAEMNWLLLQPLSPQQTIYITNNVDYIATINLLGTPTAVAGWIERGADRGVMQTLSGITWSGWGDWSFIENA